MSMLPAGHSKVPAYGACAVMTNSNTKRASGAEFATGELLALLDDNDEWLPSYLSEVVALFKSKDLDVVCTDLLCQFDDGLDRLGKVAPDTLAPELFLTRNPGLIGSNLFIRRLLYRDTGGFDESLLAAEDMEFGLRLSLRGSVKYHLCDNDWCVTMSTRQPGFVPPKAKRCAAESVDSISSMRIA